MDASRYFDSAATTPLDSRVLAEMMPFLTSEFGNAHSVHGFGLRASHHVELARERVASLIGAESPEQIIFTSGATEACNGIIRSFTRGYVGPFEHSAVRVTALHQGFSIIPNDGAKLLPNPGRPEPRSLACQMRANNETGMIFDPGAEAATWGEFLLTDVTQTMGKISVTIPENGFVAGSAHKVYGPKGIGFLAFGDTMPDPIMLGGEQEWGLRAGTLNVPGIVGLGAACAIAEEQMAADYAHVSELRNIVIEGLAKCGEWRINEDPGHQLPHILSISFRGVQGETVVIEADQAGFAISSGAACSQGSTEPSHVLTALSVPDEWLRGTVRISCGRTNTAESSSELAATLATIVNKLRKLST